MSGSGELFWRRGTARRAAVFVDMADYFRAARESMRLARRSIHFVNWAFDANTLFEPQPGCSGPDDDRIGAFLIALADQRPELDVRILCWDSAFPIAATQNFFPIVDRRAFRGTRVRFVLDSKVPFGACHHQKMVIIDDEVAFVGGGDIGPDRWDTSGHLDDDPRRQKTRADARCYDSRHEVMAVVDGEAARALAELFYLRWARATGESGAPGVGPSAADPWPPGVAPLLRDVPMTLSRTAPAWRGETEIREIERLTLDQIVRARSLIYLENQYFTSPLAAEALAARLIEPEGPEVVLVSTEHSPSWFDRMTMDRTRGAFIRRLRAVDAHGRLFVYAPVTTLSRTIIVHAKLGVFDDERLRIGSANMNNRSTGFDTECDVTFEAQSSEHRSVIGGLRTHLVAHWLGCPDKTVQEAVDRAGGLGLAIEALRDEGRVRLKPIPVRPMGFADRLIAGQHLGDPVTPRDSWRPWLRGPQIRSDISRLGEIWRAPGAAGQHQSDRLEVAPREGLLEWRTKSRRRRSTA